MNKRGFTLIELLSTITIMGLIATLTTINVIKIFDEKETISKNNQKEIITTAACLYIELDENKALKEKCLSTGCTLSTTTLINAGLLNQEDVDNSPVINIYKENNEKKCVIN